MNKRSILSAVGFVLVIGILFGVNGIINRMPPDKTTTHEATLKCGDFITFAIAEVYTYHESKNEEVSVLQRITVHGKKIYENIEKELNTKKQCEIEIDSHFFTVTIKDVATEDSYDLLDIGYPKTSGKYCAHKDKNTLHYASCYLAKSISKSNKIYFDSTAEAVLFGKSSDCLTCKTFWYE